ncbi:hypothetical protein RclHR1_13700009 [Rhizophagus clarus]|nr:hypothetical protein RclHR1_13700009 [Rhizophagus clarus]
MLNVFIALFSEVIKDDDVQALYWKMMAEVISEIELFYLLPFQRRWQKWFPEVFVSLGEAQIEIEKLINEGNWNINEFPEMKQNLLNKLKIQQK